MPKPKRGLGKGLEALFADNDTADVAVSTLQIGEIEPNSEQPRREFSPEALDSLAASIPGSHGVLQPLVVPAASQRALPDRRGRAALARRPDRGTDRTAGRHPGADRRAGLRNRTRGKPCARRP